MRHPVWKAVALVTAAFSLAAAFLFAGCITYLLNTGLYEKDPAALLTAAYSYRAEAIASNLANRYAEKTYSEVPDYILSEVSGPYDDKSISWRVDLKPESWYYTLHSADGQALESNAPEDVSSLYTYEFTVKGRYLQQTDVPEQANLIHTYSHVTWYLSYTDSPAYRVTVYVRKDSVEAIYGMELPVLELMHSNRYTVIALCGLGLLLYALCLVYLCLTAGRRRPGDIPCPVALNRLPLDLYLGAAGVICVLLVTFSLQLLPFHDMFYYYTDRVDPLLHLKLAASGGLLSVAAFVLTAFLFSVAAQCKMPDGYWWRNSVIFRLLKLLAWFLRGAFRLMPVIWQWLVTGLAMALLVLLSILLQSEILLVISLLLCGAILLYGAWAYGKLLQGARQMAQGRLGEKVQPKYLIGGFRDLAEDLNALSDVTLEAADVQVRSERMKAELITNVSHDIKTPLTSIINYIDLLPRAQDDAQKQEYLNILDKQSQRLKRLIEDLTEMSRASTGNIQTNIAPMDAVEGVTQALGEFTDKLTHAHLQIVTDLPAEAMMIEADGRLFWRVMSNLLSNVVKYAMPGTRFHVRLWQTQEGVQIALKNISREPLTKDARELTERFVRGDTSRNTEGSGLGLSIAGSLMEVQKGKLELQVDADLFTAILTFPAAQQSETE